MNNFKNENISDEVTIQTNCSNIKMYTENCLNKSFKLF